MQALQRRVESLNALVTAPLEPKADGTSPAQVTELKREHENMLATLIAQLQEKELDLIGLLPPAAFKVMCSVLLVMYHASSTCPTFLPRDERVQAVSHSTAYGRDNSRC